MEQHDLQDGLLSVVVPVYKVEPYLDRCVESIIHQTYRNIEIILVDDGSPDRCPEMCDRWKEKDSRIRVIHKQNGGLSDARNAGVVAATGSYLAFVDSDDYIDMEMYETMIAAINRTDAGIASCGRYIVNDSEKIPMHCMEREMVFSGTEAIRELLIGGKIEEATWDKVYRKALFEEIRFPAGEINEDIVIMPKLLDKGRKIVHVGYPFYYYCQNGESITRSAYSPKKRIMLKHLDDIEIYLADNHRELMPYFDALQGRYCQSTLYLLLDNKVVYKAYQNDYHEFYRRFQKSFRKMLKLVKTSRTEKIKGFLIYCKLYYILHLLKKGKK